MLFSAVSVAAPMTARDQSFAVETTENFVDQLVTVLPSTVNVPMLKSRARQWFKDLVEFRRSDPRLVKHSKLPFRHVNQAEYLRSAEHTADAIFDRLKQAVAGADSTGMVVGDIASFYATLATYRGDLSTQLTGGLVVAGLVPSLAILGASFPASLHLAGALGYMYWDMDLVMQRVLLPIYATELAVLGSLHAAALGTRKGRHLVRGLFAKVERTRGAAQIERAFWSRLEDRVSAQRELSGYRPNTKNVDFKTNFMWRLAQGRDLPVDCDAWLRSAW